MEAIEINDDDDATLRIMMTIIWKTLKIIMILMMSVMMVVFLMVMIIMMITHDIDANDVMYCTYLRTLVS